MAIRISTCFTCLVALSTSVLAQTVDKAATYEEMLSLARRIGVLRAQGAQPASIDTLTAQYEALQASLGGDDPAHLAKQKTPAAAGEVAVNQPHTIMSVPCVGTSPTPATFLGAIGPILDVATQIFPCPVGGLDEYLWDVDLNVNITHTFAADLDITLTSPTGTVVVITTDNGGGFDNVFAGTTFDDTANDPATDHLYANLVVATPLSPEGRLAAFRGEDPNGLWTLTITDDAAADVGALNSFTLDVSAMNVPLGAASTTLISTPGAPILDFLTTADVIPVGGLGPQIEKVVVYVEITHTWNADLNIRLISPAATDVALSTANGGSNDNVFLGTTFDPDVLDTVTDHLYANLVTATPLSPEGSFDNFVGQNPNGPWTLTVTDTAGGDIGTLIRWDLTIQTCAGPGPISYCTTGATTNQCFAHISASENPSVTFANPCVLTVEEVEGQKSGLIFYGITGPIMSPWGATSFLCVKAPTQRTQTQVTGGTAGQCDGTLTLDWNAYQSTNPGALGNPWAPGDKAWCQGWFRDPPDPKTTHMSDAVELTYQP